MTRDDLQSVLESAWAEETRRVRPSLRTRLTLIQWQLAYVRSLMADARMLLIALAVVFAGFVTGLVAGGIR